MSTKLIKAIFYHGKVLSGIEYLHLPTKSLDAEWTFVRKDDNNDENADEYLKRTFLKKYTQEQNNKILQFYKELHWNSLKSKDDNSSFYCCLFGLYLSCLCGIITNQYWKEIINQGLNQ